MSLRPVLPAPPRITGAADGTLYQIVDGVLTPIKRADGSAAEDGDSIAWSSDDGKWVAEAAGDGLSDLDPSPAGTYGDASHVPQITVDAQGRTTAVSQIEVSGLQSRGNVSVTTASLADNATANGTIALGKLVTLHIITLSRAGWLRLYCTAAARTDDAARTSDLDPIPGRGVIGEVIVDDVTGPTILLGPKFFASNGDDPVVSDIYYAYTNLSGETGTCDITISRTVQEA